jgi:exodeoxyribonuclease VII small subunit
MTMTFKEAYGVLNRHAQALRNQQEPNIDDLLGIVTESVDAYKVCKQRIDAVEAALEQALADPVVASSAANAGEDDATPRPAPPHVRPSNRGSAKSTGFDEMDDDIPF